MSYNPRPEATGNRDLRFSKRHRYYYGACSATDIDFVVGNQVDIVDADFFVEYKNGVAIAFMENKLAPAKIDLSAGQFQTYGWIADQCKRPLFLNEYIIKEDKFYFRVMALNNYATEFFDTFGIGESIALSELNFVHLLYALRGWKLTDDEVIKHLSTDEPDNDTFR